MLLDGSPVIDIKPYFPSDPANLRLPDWARRWDRRGGANEKRPVGVEFRWDRPQTAEPPESESRMSTPRFARILPIWWKERGVTMVP
jgi:hypothetical protein